MPVLSNCVRTIRPGVFAELQQRIEAHTARGGQLVPFQIGDTYLDPPEAARFALSIGDDAAAASEAALYRYGATAGMATLRTAIADRMQSRRGFTRVDPERHVLVGCGGTHALSCVARSVLDPGDDVLLAAPYWPLAPGIIHSCGARAVEVPLTNRLYDHASLDVGAVFAEAMTPRTKAIYLITPNNPDGKVLTAPQLQQIADLAKAHDLWVFADEVYADFVFDGAHASIANLDGMRERTLTAYSLSKSHALAGARIGYVVAPEEVVVAARRVSTHSLFNVPVLSQRVALAALTGGAAWSERALGTYRTLRDVAAARLRGHGFHDFHVAEGGTYLFLDLRRVLRDRPLQTLLERGIDRGVLLAPGEAFGAAYARFARLCFTAVDRPRLEDGIDRLALAIADVA